MFWPNWLGGRTLTSHFFSSFNGLVYKTLMSMCLHVFILKMLCFLKLHLKIKPHFKILDIRKLAKLIPDIFVGISTTTTQSWYIFRYIFFCFWLFAFYSSTPINFLLINHHRWVLKHFPSDFFWLYILCLPILSKVRIQGW